MNAEKVTNVISLGKKTAEIDSAFLRSSSRTQVLARYLQEIEAPSAQTVLRSHHQCPEVGHSIAITGSNLRIDNG